MINTEEAPLGFIAVKADENGSCKGCYFDTAKLSTVCASRACCSMKRQDREFVIFIENY